MIEFDNLCSDVSLVAMDFPSKIYGLDLDEVLTDADLDEPGLDL